MKQWTTKQDGLDKLQFVDAPEPGAELKDGEVLVKIGHVSINYRDTEVVMGDYSHHKSLQDESALVPCSDMCGIVTKVGGNNSNNIKQGDRVMSIFNQTHLTGQVQEKDMASGLGKPLPGVLAEYRVFPATGLVKVPEYLTDAEAATLPIAAVTAWMAINSFQPKGEPLRGKEKVVLLQGTGGVSVSGLQIAKALGLTTIVTSSSDAKLARARSLGADHTINYKTTPDWDDAVLSLTQNRGADIIFECGGAGTLAKSFNCVAFGGLISCIGYLSGKEDPAGKPQLGTNVLALRRNVTLKGMLNGPRDRLEEMLREVYDKEKIRPVVDREFGFDKADEALRYVQSGGHFGKVVVKVN